MSKEPIRHVHADLIIMHVNDMSLQFDWYNEDQKQWCLLDKNWEFYKHCKYRLHEREFPKTSLSFDELNTIYCESRFLMSVEQGLIEVANAAIKQYILDAEKESGE